MANKINLMNPRRLELARPDLWLEFLEILKNDSPNFHELIINDKRVSLLTNQYGGTMRINIDDLPKKAQDLIYKAAKEKAEKNAAH